VCVSVREREKGRGKESNKMSKIGINRKERMNAIELTKSG
jgi:hypothetical protein